MRDLEDLFLYLCEEEADGTRKIAYKDFIEKLQKEDEAVSERSIFRLEKDVRVLEQRMDEVLEGLGLMHPQRMRHHSLHVKARTLSVRRDSLADDEEENVIMTVPLTKQDTKRDSVFKDAKALHKLLE